MNTRNSQDRTYFVISFDDKDHARSLGAKFDWDRKIWYAPNKKTKDALLTVYKEYKPFDGFVGEDRTFGGNQLFIDMIPSTTFYKNVRAMIYKGDWTVIRNFIYNRVSEKCECCGIDSSGDSRLYDTDIITLEDLTGIKIDDINDFIKDEELVGLSPEELPEDLIDFYYGGKNNLDKRKKDVVTWNTVGLEAHERWSYDKDTKVQKLERIIALCHRCHSLTHHGLAGLRGVHKFAEKHLMKVNGWTEEQVSKHIEEQWSIWKERSKIDWKLDVSLITNSGLKLNQTS